MMVTPVLSAISMMLFVIVSAYNQEMIQMAMEFVMTMTFAQAVMTMQMKMETVSQIIAIHVMTLPLAAHVMMVILVLF